MSNLIAPDRVQTNSYYLKYRKEFRLAGFIEVTPWTDLPDYQTWDLPTWNPFCNIAHTALVDDKETLILPVFVNDAVILDICFDGDIKCTAEYNQYLPAIAFFKGNDDFSCALRFKTFEERDDMISAFGEEVGMSSDLIWQN